MHRSWRFRWAYETPQRLRAGGTQHNLGTPFAVAWGMDKPNTPAPEKPHYAQPKEPREGAPTPKPRPGPSQDDERSLPFLPIG